MAPRVPAVPPRLRRDVRLVRTLARTSVWILCDRLWGHPRAAFPRHWTEITQSWLPTVHAAGAVRLHQRRAVSNGAEYPARTPARSRGFRARLRCDRGHRASDRSRRHPRRYYVKVSVSHCGINSTHESLYAGTPIVGIPMLADQRDMAVRVADAGVGLWLNKQRFAAHELRDAIVRVIEDDAFERRIPSVREAFARAGGVRRAADLIEEAAAARLKASPSIGR